jgi:hypothetical protein
VLHCWSNFERVYDQKKYLTLKLQKCELGDSIAEKS